MQAFANCSQGPSVHSAQRGIVLSCRDAGRRGGAREAAGRVPLHRAVWATMVPVSCVAGEIKRCSRLVRCGSCLDSTVGGQRVRVRCAYFVRCLVISAAAARASGLRPRAPRPRRAGPVAAAHRDQRPPEAAN